MIAPSAAAGVTSSGCRDAAASIYIMIDLAVFNGPRCRPQSIQLLGEFHVHFTRIITS
jgi:hypothetical protein